MVTWREYFNLDKYEKAPYFYLMLMISAMSPVQAALDVAFGKLPWTIGLLANMLIAAVLLQLIVWLVSVDKLNQTQRFVIGFAALIAASALAAYMF